MLYRLFFITLLVSGFSAPSSADEDSTSGIYYPGAGDTWQSRPPAESGVDPDLLSEAIEYVQQHESDMDIDLRANLARGNQGPGNELVGPFKNRGPMNGLVIKDGYIVAEFGDTRKVDMTFSVTKSFVSTTAGLAMDAGRIKNLRDPVSQYVHDGNFDGTRHSKITWQQLFQQTSEWEGTLWDKPDTVDRRKGKDRTVNTPGTFWEYNDVRVNLAALAMLRVWEKPLPHVLKERLMDPINASNTWQWHGYSNSDVVINGEAMKSVSGGGHWGGGMWISTRDMARFGYLYLRRGQWQDQQLLSTNWIDQATTPTAIQPTYGYMFWLNTGKKLWPDAPADSYAAIGGGSNIIWIYPKHKMVAVIRWIDREAVNTYVSMLAAAVEN
jgi:CubicO group peptidase (beta-lactamase class C family)